MSHELTPREQAKLEDFVRKGLGGTADTPPSPKDETGSSLREQDEEQREKLSPVSPSVKSSKRVVQESGSAPSKQKKDDDDDIDLFARGNVSRVVDEFRAEKVEKEQRAVAKKAGLPFVRLMGYPISPEVLALIPREIAEKYGVISYIKVGNKVRVGVRHPGTKQTAQVLESLNRATDHDYLVSAIGEDSYRYALKLYDELPAARAATSDVSVDEKEKKSFETDIQSFLDLRSRIKDVPTTKVVDTLLTGAVKVGASDVHIEPMEEGVRIRYRIDGVLHTVADFKTDILQSLLSRLKFLAKLKLDVNRLPQDGRFTITDKQQDRSVELDVRVATIPSQYGEAITMRLLNRDATGITLDALGLTGEARRKVLAAIDRPQGMVLECGPTGSGKTTTLYSLLTRLNDPGKKLVTLEDPVEYRLPGVMQSQVDPAHGYDFAEGFRSVLRLDPDVLMIGEIRDSKTADQAVQASLTGHIVLSTLHTNDAPTAIPRLTDIGVRPFLLANAINAIIAQRLVRKICIHCAAETKPDTATLEAVQEVLKALPEHAKDSLPPKKEWLFMKGKGCAQCNGTGFSGRIGIFEVLVISDEIERLAMNRAPISQLRQAAHRTGMMTMEQDGLLKALAGVTTISEVWRVARNV
ncbi:MAG: GspE/PulE family protein [Patescibacteria group bacterium]